MPSLLWGKSPAASLEDDAFRQERIALDGHRKNLSRVSPLTLVAEVVLPKVNR